MEQRNASWTDPCQLWQCIYCMQYLINDSCTQSTSQVDEISIKKEHWRFYLRQSTLVLTAQSMAISLVLVWVLGPLFVTNHCLFSKYNSTISKCQVIKPNALFPPKNNSGMLSKLVFISSSWLVVLLLKWKKEGTRGKEIFNPRT